jgi:hypothetical protein
VKAMKEVDMIILLLGKRDLIIYLDFTSDYNFRKNSLPWHDAVPDCVKNVAPGVTNLADLCDFQEDVAPDLQSRADGKRRQINAFRSQVFRKISILHIQSLCPDFLDAFFRKEAYLPDTALRMGVAIKANIFQKQTAGDILFFFTFFLRNVDGQNLSLYFFHLKVPIKSLFIFSTLP